MKTMKKDVWIILTALPVAGFIGGTALLWTVIGAIEVGMIG